MKHMKNLGLAALSLIVAAQAHALPVGEFGVDTADIVTDIGLVGTALVGVAVLFLTYKMTRRLLAR